jgi:hypothetical protein
MERVQPGIASGSTERAVARPTDEPANLSDSVGFSRTPDAFETPEPHDPYPVSR